MEWNRRALPSQLPEIRGEWYAVEAAGKDERVDHGRVGDDGRGSWECSVEMIVDASRRVESTSARVIDAHPDDPWKSTRTRRRRRRPSFVSSRGRLVTAAPRWFPSAAPAPGASTPSAATAAAAAAAATAARRAAAAPPRRFSDASPPVPPPPNRPRKIPSPSASQSPSQSPSPIRTQTRIRTRTRRLPRPSPRHLPRPSPRCRRRHPSPILSSSSRTRSSSPASPPLFAFARRLPRRRRLRRRPRPPPRARVPFEISRDAGDGARSFGRFPRAKRLRIHAHDASERKIFSVDDGRGQHCERVLKRRLDLPRGVAVSSEVVRGILQVLNGEEERSPRVRPLLIALGEESSAAAARYPDVVRVDSPSVEFRKKSMSKTPRRPSAAASPLSSAHADAVALASWSCRCAMTMHSSA